MHPLSIPLSQDDRTLALLYRLQVRDLEDVVMFITDPEGTLLTWNRAVQETFGYTESEWVGRSASMIFTDEDRSSGIHEREMQRAAEEGRSTDIRWHERKDGSRIYTVGILKALRDDSDRVIGYTKVVMDDTGRKRLEDALMQSNADLQQFAFIASHDIQEPLRTLTSYAQLLERRFGEQLGEAGRDFITSIVSSVTRLRSLVRDLLEYSRLNYDDHDTVSIHLDEDFETAVLMLRSSIEAAGAVITHDPLPNVRLYRGQMVRLFQNLLSNAIKFRRSDVAPRVHVSAERREEHWLIRVQDNGIGFPAEYAETIFAPFKRLHSADQYPGSGIGLAACKRIVERFGGAIGAVSEPGNGASFWFTIPIEVEKRGVVARQETEPGSNPTPAE